MADGRGPARLLLVGMMGAGKSTVARAMADQLRWPLLDTDRAIEQRKGRSVQDIFAREGEEAFRAQETCELQAVARLTGPIVVSVGGGAVTVEVNREILRTAGTVIWLRAALPTLVARVGSGRGRPLLASAGAGTEEVLQRLAEQRQFWYEEVADVVMDVDGLATPEVAARLIGDLGLG